MVQLLQKVRIESVIVIAGLLVLMFCSRPPRSGTANVNPVGSETTPAETPIEELSLDSLPELIESLPATSKPTMTEQPAALQVQKPTKRMAKVDARNCPGLKYDKVMYGEVSVQWVWNGHELAPTKVVVVDEGNGVSTIWNFESQDGVIVTELPPDTPPLP